MTGYEEIVALWKSYKITTAEALDQYLHNFRILFAYNSSKIENDDVTYHDTKEIFENGRILNYTGNPRTLFEQQNQKLLELAVHKTEMYSTELCHEFLKNKIIAKKFVNVDLIKDIHEILTAGTYDEHRFIANGERPGEFKKHDYVTGIYEVGSASEDVIHDINSLIREVGDYKGDDYLKAATYFHLKFEDIHPFADGNGRVGRTLTNYYLMINDYPPFIVYDEDKRFYYECLQKYDEKEDIKPAYEFFKYQTEKTWDKALKLERNR